MKPNKQIIFGPFRFDEVNECLWRNSQPIQLRPKAFGVLKYLIERAGMLVTKEQLLQEVWPDTFVGDAVLKDCIRQIREAFGDDAKSPQFIETAHRRGYRFIAPINELSAHTQEASPELRQSYASGANPRPDVAVLDRDESLAKLAGWLEKALGGKSQIVFITGEAGIGKTTLVEEFLRRTAEVQDIWIARGQCLEQYGAGEAYLPVLDCFSRLCRGRLRDRCIEVLRNNAPTWLAQMPSLSSRTEREELQEQATGITRDRMLREVTEAVEALTADTPLILVLEDLHWSDYSTLDLISYLARRQQSSRLLLIGTYRPVEVILNEHPLKDVKRELQMHRLCHELPLEYLTTATVSEFLRLKFSPHRFPDTLASIIHERTEGNPLFMINVIDYLVEEKIIAQTNGEWNLAVKLDKFCCDVPENIRYLIEKHLERLTPDEQRVLEGASVVGMDCSAVAMSAGLGDDVLKIEEVCDGLARQNHFLLPAYLAELPDGTITPRYRFIHALYLDVLYSRLPATRRSQIHGRIGERGEAVYGERVDEIAAELAVHFEQARDNTKAVKYLQLAAENAARRSADHEVVSLVRRGLELLKTLPNTPERDHQEAALLRRLSHAHAAASYN